VDQERLKSRQLPKRVEHRFALQVKLKVFVRARFVSLEQTKCSFRLTRLGKPPRQVRRTMNRWRQGVGVRNGLLEDAVRGTTIVAPPRELREPGETEELFRPVAESNGGLVSRSRRIPLAAAAMSKADRLSREHV